MKSFGAGFVIPGAATGLSGAVFADALTRRFASSGGFLLDAYHSLAGAGNAATALVIAVLAGAATAVGIVALMIFFALFDGRMVASVRIATMTKMQALGVDPGTVVHHLAAASPSCHRDSQGDTARMIAALGLSVAAEPVAREIEYRRQLRQVASGLIPTIVLLMAWAVLVARLSWGGLVVVMLALLSGCGGIRMLRVAARYQESERAFQAFAAAAHAAAQMSAGRPTAQRGHQASPTRASVSAPASSAVTRLPAGRPKRS